MTAESVVPTEWRIRARAAIADIHATLDSFREEWYPKDAPAPARQIVRASIAHGYAGWALFYAYVGDRRRAEELLERAIVEASDSFMPPTLYEGLAGVAWAAEHLRRLGLVDGDLIGDDIDECFLASLKDTTCWQSPELVTGAAGLGVYALERWPHGLSAEILAAAIDVIDSSALRDGDSVSWFLPREQMPERNQRKGSTGWWDLGVAHGISGIGLFLLAAMPRAPQPGRAADLVRGAVRFIQTRELSDDEPSRFPSFVIPAFEPQSPSRLAWCYGDLGVAFFFCRAGTALGERSLLDRGRSLAQLCAARQAVTGVVDASFCHGAVGVAQMFRRLASYDDELRIAEDRWLERALDFRADGGVAGFAYSYDLIDFDGSVEHNWIDNPGLLLGAAGIGLGLLSALSKTEPSWDRLFLLS